MTDGPSPKTAPELEPVDASAGAVLDPLIGQRIGEYEVLAHLAEGGMGVVYRGVHPVIKKRVAIKVLKPEIGNVAVHLEQLAAEAEAVNSIGHRNIVDIFGMGQLPDGRPYIIMEYLEGKALDVYFDEHQSRLPLTEVVEILYEMCAPLAAAHKARVIHRDLKPSNVFLCLQPDGSRFLKLLDFGLAKKALGLDGVTEQTAKATVAGTPDYMAPEHAQGKAISPRTDLYALGCIGYFLLTGKLPFTGLTPLDMMIAHVRVPPPRVSASTPDIPPELDELVFAMMAKDPDRRPQSTDEVRDALRGVLEALGVAPTESNSATSGRFPARASAPRHGGPAPSTPRAPGASGVRAAHVPSAEAPPGRGEAPAPAGDAGATAPGGATPEPPLPAAIPAVGADAAQRAPPDGGAPSPRVAAAPPLDASPSRPVGLIAGLVVALVVIVVGGAWLVSAPTAPVAAPEGVAVPPDPLPLVAPGAPPSKAGVGGGSPTAVPAPPGPQAGSGKNGASAAPGLPPLEELAPLPSAGTGPVPKRVEARVPTEQELRTRLASLELKLRRTVPRGEEPDPAALQYLAKYRVQATMAEGGADRVKLWRQLDQWERLFLQR